MIARQQRHTRQNPCKVCLGHDAIQPGRGERCWGFLSTDGLYEHCTNDQYAGGLPLHPGKDGAASTYAHKLNGDCKCGAVHGRQIEARVVPIRREPEKPLRVIEPWEFEEAVAVFEYETDEPTPRRLRISKFVSEGRRAFKPAIQREDGDWMGWSMQGLPPQLYRRGELIAAVDAGDPVWVAEGEKDVDALRDRGLAATCNSGGTGGGFKIEMAPLFRGADVTIVQDKDDPGRKHAQDIAKKLTGIAKRVRIVEAKTGKDSHDHLAAGHGISDFVHVWPLEGLRETDPIEWKRRILTESLQLGDPFEDGDDTESTLALPGCPRYSTGISGPVPLYRLEGWTVVAGDRGAAKSYFALSSSLHSAICEDWEVFYINCEMEPITLAKRMNQYTQGSPRPKNWHIVRAKYGCNIEGLIEYLSPRLTVRKTLLVFDSMTSFIDQALSVNPKDPLGLNDNKRLCIWLMNLVNESNGQIAVLALSETNASGGVKFRMADYKANIVLSMGTSDRSDEIKTIEVMKDRSKPSRAKFEVELDWRNCRLVSCETTEKGYLSDDD